MIFFAPLTFFFPKLAALRRLGFLQYGALAHLHSEQFHRKWIEQRDQHRDELMGAPEMSSMIDLAGCFANVKNMRPIPIETEALLKVIFAVAIPLVPVVTTRIPLTVLLKQLLSAFALNNCETRAVRASSNIS